MISSRDSFRVILKLMLFSKQSSCQIIIFSLVTRRQQSYFIFNNQPDAQILQLYSVIKLYMFPASSLPIIRSFLLYCTLALVSFMHVFDDRFEAESRWNILTLLGSGQIKPACNLPVPNVQ
jgi:hypothetical protein